MMMGSRVAKKRESLKEGTKGTEGGHGHVQLSHTHTELPNVRGRVIDAPVAVETEMTTSGNHEFQLDEELMPTLESYLSKTGSNPRMLECPESQCRQICRSKPGFIIHVKSRHLKRIIIEPPQEKVMMSSSSSTSRSESTQVAEAEDSSLNMGSSSAELMKGQSGTISNTVSGSHASSTFDVPILDEDGGEVKELDSDVQNEATDETGSSFLGNNIICSVCKDIFPYNTQFNMKIFKKHLDIHYGLRPFICPYPKCGASFQTSIRVMTHSALHTGDFNYECDVCNLKFRTNAELLGHNRNCK